MSVTGHTHAKSLPLEENSKFNVSGFLGLMLKVGGHLKLFLSVCFCIIKST